MPHLDAALRSALLLFVLLNPFLMMIYLLDIVQRLDARRFRSVLVRAALISIGVFAVFAATGDLVFVDVLQVRFESFLIFGGVVFLLIGLRFVFQGPEALEAMRGAPEHLAGSIALPFMIGPGTLSASVVAGARTPFPWALGAIAGAVLASVVCVVLLKLLHDHVRKRHEALVERYIDVVGRISALVVGTVAVEMIVRGVEGVLDAA
jgi:small neutral amino acid transporter SnatA (MarC family)